MFKAGQCIFIRKSLAVDVSEMGIGKGIDGFINAGGVQGDFGCIIDKKPSRAPGGVFCVEVPGGKGSKKRRRVCGAVYRKAKRVDLLRSEDVSPILDAVC